jgi:Family of unknown function (DUF5808)
MHMPYDWRRPSGARIRRRWWNPDDPRILVPKAFGWGYVINFGALWRLLSTRGRGARIRSGQ